MSAIKYEPDKQLPTIIHQITARIVDAISPEKIILFGSYASGETSPDSDIDLLIIKKTQERPAERQRIISRLFFPRKSLWTSSLKRQQKLKRPQKDLIHLLMKF